jgi:uncharacterized protein YndB with AHSA1/START domain
VARRAYSARVRLRIEQRFAATPEQVCAALVDPDYVVHAMGSLKDVGPPIVESQVRNGDTVRQRVIYRFTGKLPGAVTAVIDPKRLTWTEDTTVDTVRGTARFVMTPVHYPNFFTATGTWTLREDGDSTPAKPTTLRLIEGELKVRSPVPFVGGQVEKAIVSGLSDRLADEPAAFARWYATTS